MINAQEAKKRTECALRQDVEKLEKEAEHIFHEAEALILNASAWGHHHTQVSFARFHYVAPDILLKYVLDKLSSLGYSVLDEQDDWLETISISW